MVSTTKISLSPLYAVIKAKELAHNMQKAISPRKSTLPPIEIHRKLSNVAHFFTLLALKTQRFITLDDPITWHGTRETTVKVVDSFMSENKNIEMLPGIEDKVRNFLKDDLNEDGSNIHIRAMCVMRFFGKLEQLHTTIPDVTLSDLILRAFGTGGILDLKSHDLKDNDFERILELAEKVVGLT